IMSNVARYFAKAGIYISWQLTALQGYEKTPIHNFTVKKLQLEKDPATDIPYAVSESEIDDVLWLDKHFPKVWEFPQIFFVRRFVDVPASGLTFRGLGRSVIERDHLSTDSLKKLVVHELMWILNYPRPGKQKGFTNPNDWFYASLDDPFPRDEMEI